MWQYLGVSHTVIDFIVILIISIMYWGGGVNISQIFQEMQRLHLLPKF